MFIYANYFPLIFRDCMEIKRKINKELMKMWEHRHIAKISSPYGESELEQTVNGHFRGVIIKRLMGVN